MNRTHHVAWAAAARNDLKRIIDHIALDSPDDALRVLHKIRLRSTELQTMSEQGRVVPELKEQGIQTYRELIVTPWRIIYRISDTTVFVLCVIDSRRNVEDILLDRLIK